MKILLTTPYIPYPLDSGGNQAVFSMLEAIGRRHRLTVVFNGREDDNARSLEQMLPQVQFIFFNGGGGSRNPFTPYGLADGKYRLRSYLAASFQRKLGRFLYRHSDEDCLSKAFPRRKSSLTNMVLSQNVNHPFYLFFAQLAKEGDYDAVQMEFYSNLELAYYLPEDIVKIFVHHEIRYIRIENEISLYEDRGPEDLVLYEKAKDRELAMLKRFDHIITLTETDKEILSKDLPGARIYASPAIVHDREVLPFKACRNELVLCGSGAHYPNLDGLLWFCRRVWPILREKNDDITIFVTGTWSKQLQKQMSDLCPRLVFAGFVDDLHHFINGKISIIPIRIGSGMRMKVLDSIYASSPFVITFKGIEGQNFTSEKDCLIADEAEDFAAAIIRLQEDTALQEELSGQAIVKIRRDYAPEKMRDIRLGIYEQIEKEIKSKE